MSEKDELRVSSLLSLILNVQFENTKYRLDEWGFVDNWSKIDEDCYLFLEVETSQKHPCTNVLKLWPFLEFHKSKRIFLIQSFFSNSPSLSSNRGKLSVWTGKKLEYYYPNNFKYLRIVFDEMDDKDNLSHLKDEFRNFFV